jgi:hypothetical protein
MIEGNWILHASKPSDYDFDTYIDNQPSIVTLVDYKMADDGISYMLYNASQGKVNLARFHPDGRVVVVKLGKGRGVSLAIGPNDLPHVLYHTPDKVIQYARPEISGLKWTGKAGEPVFMEAKWKNKSLPLKK